MSVTVHNNIPDDVRTPPMFPAELLAVITNLLTNAIKAAGFNGRVEANASTDGRDKVKFRIENTGVSVAPADGEAWFVPFASTGAEIDTTLGQGTGLGLPIVRDILAEYGSSVQFVDPSDGYATAVEVNLVA
jgi:signal transduction histidine kinase